MRRFSIVCVLFGLFFGFSVSTVAEEGWYLGGRISWVKLHESDGGVIRTEVNNNTTGTVEVEELAILLPEDSTTTLSIFNSDSEESIGGSVYVGYDFTGPFRVDLEYRHLSNDIDRIRQRNNQQATVTNDENGSKSLVANFWFDFFRWGNFVPYVGAGLGAAEITLGNSKDTVLAVQGGFGVNWYVNPRMAIDVSYRWLSAKDPEFEFEADRVITEYEAESASLGLRYNFYTAADSKDRDGDGVSNSLDKCPRTPRGTPVDQHGCTADSDLDGVTDGRDQCPDTPRGAIVDARGCPSDEDNDGVYDGLDLCPGTRPNAKVNTVGCSGMGAGGVTAKDICPAVIPVTTHYNNNEGDCTPEQRAILQGVNFEYNSAKLTTSAREILDRVAESLKMALIQNRALIVQIQGHTDSLGSDRYNFDLSKARAESVRRYLMAGGVNPRALRADGFGETQPIASNDTDAGRAMNRRVELRFYN